MGEKLDLEVEKCYDLKTALSKLTREVDYKKQDADKKREKLEAKLKSNHENL